MTSELKVIKVDQLITYKTKSSSSDTTTIFSGHQVYELVYLTYASLTNIVKLCEKINSVPSKEMYITSITRETMVKI